MTIKISNPVSNHWMDRTPGWILPYEEAFLEGLARTLREDAKIVNIGGAVGTSSSAIMRGLFHLDKYELVSVDIEECPVELETLEMQGLLDEAHFKQVVMDSNEFGKMINLDLDMVFIDGSHQYKPVLEDLRLYSKHLKPGGLLVAHDYKDTNQENVTKAIEKWRSYKKNENWIMIGHVLYTVAFMKPGGNTAWKNGRLE